MPRHKKSPQKKRKPLGKLGQVIVISLFVLLFSLIVILTKFLGTPSLTIETVVTGLFGAYGFYILEKYVIDAIPISNRILKYLASAIVLLAFLFVVLVVLAGIETVVLVIGNFVGFHVAPVGQNIISEDIGGVVGSWIMYLISILLGLMTVRSKQKRK